MDFWSTEVKRVEKQLRLSSTLPHPLYLAFSLGEKTNKKMHKAHLGQKVVVAGQSNML